MMLCWFTEKNISIRKILSRMVYGFFCVGDAVILPTSKFEANELDKEASRVLEQGAAK